MALQGSKSREKRATGLKTQDDSLALNAAQAPTYLIQGHAAHLFLADGEFQLAWTRLCEVCPWATVFQSPGFAITWYKAYQTRFTPVLVTDFQKGLGMSGLLTLATSGNSGDLVVAGAHQAEYHAWIANPSLGDSFIRKALEKIHDAYPNASLSFKYLPPATPTGWTAGLRYCSLQAHARPIMALDGSIQNKNKNRLTNRLARLGELSFERISTADVFASILEALLSHYDLRQGAINDAAPFQDDPLKRAFYLDLMKVPGVMHAVALKLAGSFIAAHFGACDKKTVYVGVLVHSALYAKQSPGTLLIKMLASQMAREGYRYLDLTPGGAYKERFATGHDTVHTLRVFFKSTRLKFYRTKEGFRAGTARILKPFVAKHPGLRALVEKSVSYVRSGSSLAARRNTLRKLWDKAELRFYACRLQDIAVAEPKRPLSRNHVEDLLKWPLDNPRQLRKAFFAQCLQRLENGVHVYTRIEGGHLVYCGWLTECQESIVVGGVQREFRFPPDSALIFDIYRTLNSGVRDLNESALHQMLGDAAAIPGVNQVYVAVDGDDLIQRQAVEQLGLTPVCKILWSTVLGRTSFTLKEYASDGTTCSQVFPPPRVTPSKNERV